VAAAAGISVGVVVIVLGATAVGVSRLLIVCGPLAAATIGLIRLMVAGRAERRLVEELPDVLDAMARAASAGVSAAEAVRQGAAVAAGGLADDLAGVLFDVDRGATLADALESWARRRHRAEVDLVASGLAMAIVTGGSISWAAHHLGDVVRANLDGRAAIVAQAAQARASAMVIGATPVVVLGVTALVDPTATAVLFGTAVGQSCAVAGLLLAGGAVWWMAAIIRSAEAAVT
jgi:tight adherence protein B